MDNYSLDKLGVPGFEKFLFLLLLCVTIIWLTWIYPISRFWLPSLDTQSQISRLNRKLIAVRMQAPELSSELSPIEQTPKEQSLEKQSGKVVEAEASASHDEMKPPASLRSDIDLLPSAPSVPPVVDRVPTSEGLSVQLPSLARKRMPSSEQLVDLIVENHLIENYRGDDLDNVDTPKSPTPDVFDPRLAATLASIRAKKAQRVNRAGTVATSYVDNNQLKHYRKGNNCLQVRRVYGFGERWFKAACPQPEEEFEFNFKADK